MEKKMKLARRATALVVREGKVLSVRDLYGEGSNWGFPFYDVKNGESEEEVLKRGLLEDFHIQVSVDHHVGNQGLEREDDFLLRRTFICTYISGDIPESFPNRFRWLDRKETFSYLWNEEDEVSICRIRWYLECGDVLKVRYVGESIPELTNGKVYQCNMVIDSDMLIADNSGWEHFYDPTGVFVSVDGDEDNIQQIGYWEVAVDDKHESMRKLIDGWIRIERTDGLLFWAPPEFQRKFNDMMDNLRNGKSDEE